MPSFAERVQARRRLELLLLLKQSPRYGANFATLVHGVADRGSAASHDALNADLAWLKKEGLVNVQATESGPVVIATRRGLDVAAGLQHVAGVSAPNIEDLE